MNLQKYAKELQERYGWNIVPMYYMIRNIEDNTKKVKLIEWQKYKSQQYNLDEWSDQYKALSIITGKISDLTVLDIDSEEALNTILNELGCDINDLSNYIIKTVKGYQLFYKYLPNSRTKIGIKDKVDFLNGGLTFALPCNQGYKLLKEGSPDNMPEELQKLILANEEDEASEEAREFERALKANSTLPYRNPLAFLLKDFIAADRVSSKLRKRLEDVFCHKEYKEYSLKDFSIKGQIHASMMYVIGIVADNPTVSKDLFISFVEEWAKKVAKIDLSLQEEQMKLKNRIKGGLNIFNYNPEWKQKHESLSNIEHIADRASLKLWVDPVTEKYVMYKQKQNRVERLSKPMFKDRVVNYHNSLTPEDQITVDDVDTTKLPTIYDTFDPTVDDEFFIDDKGEHMFNNFRRSPMLQHFLTCEPLEEPPTLIKNILEHTYPIKEERDIFLHALAYHMTYLQVASTAFVLTGKSGTGKNTLFNDILGEIYGTEMHEAINLNSMTGRFRDKLKNKLLVFIDEVEEKGPKLLHSALKLAVGNPTISIESKGRDEVTYPNHAFYVAASNKDVPFKLEEGFDRRINITKTKDANLQTVDWFPSDLSRLELRDKITSEVPDFVRYLASIELSHKKSGAIINNIHRENLLKESTPLVTKYVTAILDKDMDALYELDHDFADWFNKVFVLGNKASCSSKDFREALGDIAPSVVKELKKEGVVVKNVRNVFSIVLFPSSSDEPFKEVS